MTKYKNKQSIEKIIIEAYEIYVLIYLIKMMLSVHKEVSNLENITRKTYLSLKKKRKNKKGL